MGIFFLYANVRDDSPFIKEKESAPFTVDLNSNDLVLEGYLWHNLDTENVYKSTDLDFYVKLSDGSFKKVG